MSGSNLGSADLDAVRPASTSDKEIVPVTRIRNVFPESWLWANSSVG